MAIVETGLGWYADSSWLTNLAANIGEVTGGGGGGSSSLNSWTFDSPNQPISVLSDPSYPDGTYAYMQSNNYGPGYVSCASGAVYCFAVISNNNRNVYFASLTNGVTCYTVFNDDTRWNAYTNTYHAASGFYYGSFTGSRATTNPNDYEIPAFTSLDIALLELSGIGTTATFSKSAPGYSVVCMCKWKTSLGGSVYCSPILISSEVANTYFSQDGSVVSVPSTTHTFYGMTFHMRKFTDLTLHGSETVTSNFPVLDYSESPPLSDNPLFALIASASSLGVGYSPQSDDPYSGGGTSEPGGGDGTFDNTSDTIDDSSLPSFSFAASGFTRIYNPSLSQLNSLANYMWTDQTFLQTVVNHLKQLLENPMDAVISLSRVPVPVPQGTSEEVKVMYIPTGVYMPPATTQFVDVDCGSLLIDEHYGSALDYNPYTKVSLFLPFVGMVNLDTDEVMNKTIFVKYRVDIVSGACVAKVFVGDVNDSSCLYQYSGDCSIAMPINSADFSGYKAAVIGAAKAIALGAAAAGSGILAAAEASQFESAVSGGAEMTFTEEQKSQYDKAMSNISSSIRNAPEKASFADASKKQFSNTVGSVIGGKLEVEHSGGFSGNTGVLGIRRPYVVIKRPKMCNPEQYGKYNGRPCQMYLSLAQLSGYTEVQSIQLTGFSATNPELAEIAKLLKGGVIL